MEGVGGWVGGGRRNCRQFVVAPHREFILQERQACLHKVPSKYARTSFNCTSLMQERHSVVALPSLAPGQATSDPSYHQNGYRLRRNGRCTEFADILPSRRQATL